MVASGSTTAGGSVGVVGDGKCGSIGGSGIVPVLVSFCVVTVGMVTVIVLAVSLY